MRSAASHLSHVAKSKLLLLRRCFSPRPKPPPLPLSTPLTKTLNPSLRRPFCSDSSNFSDGLSEIRDRILLLSEKPTHLTRHTIPQDVWCKISDLADELVSLPDHEDLQLFLDSSSATSLLQQSHDAFAELLGLLHFRPLLGLEVFNWRKRQEEAGYPITPEEYAKAITLAGRAKNVDLIAELFSTAGTKGIRTTSMYNTLMAAFMYNGLTKKSLSLFEDLKRDRICSPTIGTYNILLSVFGRSMLVDHMETVLRVIKKSDLMPNLSTYNTVIAGYVTAWMWDKMESTFGTMVDGSVKPDACTHLLMLRGYAHSGNLEKMENTYELVKEQVNDREVTLLRAMVCAYCKSSDPERIRKIEVLAKYIPKDEYRPWLNVLMIRVYAQEGLVERMESFITEAFDRNTIVTTLDVMQSIISSYFQCNAVDRLAGFAKQAESAGWRLCRSLYHCKMVMYGQQSRFEEMQSVIDEMEFSKFHPSKKTFLIMYKAYSSFGKKSEAEGIIGTMWKHGFAIPSDALP